MTNLLVILNHPSHYRKSIYELISQNFDCRFYFGDLSWLQIKELSNPLFDYKKLYSINLFNVAYIIFGSLLIFLRSKEKNILLTGEIRSLSVWLILIFNIFLKKNISLWGHGFYGKENFFVVTIKKFFFGLANYNLVYGERSKNLMILHGFDSQKVYVINNSLDYISMLKHRNNSSANNVLNEKFKNNFTNLIFIGRLTKVKKINQLIHAVYRLKLEKKFFNLTIIGDGDCKKELVDLVSKLCLSNQVWFFGKSYNEASISSIIKSADICVSPGNIGLAAVHSMSYGTPVISNNNFDTQMPEFELIIPEKTGLFFKENDIADLTIKILSLKKLIKVKKNKIQQNCFDIIDEFYNPNYQIKILKKVIL